MKTATRRKHPIPLDDIVTVLDFMYEEVFYLNKSADDPEEYKYLEEVADRVAAWFDTVPGSGRVEKLADLAAANNKSGYQLEAERV